MEKNLAPWAQPTFSRLADVAVTATRTGSVDCPIANAIIESLRFELENAQEMVKCLQQELRKERGNSDDE
jgi:hypothetical protein